MNEALRPCPFCGSEDLTKMMGRDSWHCNMCGADGNRWSHRTPGPATKAMLQEVTMALREGWGETVINAGTMEEFLREWDQEVPK